MEVTRKQNTPNFPKNDHFLSPIRTPTWALGSRKHSFFLEIWRALFSCYLRFEICPSPLLPMSDGIKMTVNTEIMKL